MTATFSNPNHPEYGQITLSLLVSRKDHASALSLLDEFEMGDVIQRDCRLDEIDSAFPVLKRLEGSMVNFDELEYLAKRLDRFDIGEAAQFQAMAEKLKLTEMNDFINLTFCCQQTTVITDFSDLEAVGRDHYMNLHGGCASVQELEGVSDHL